MMKHKEVGPKPVRALHTDVKISTRPTFEEIIKAKEEWIWETEQKAQKAFEKFKNSQEEEFKKFSSKLSKEN